MLLALAVVLVVVVHRVGDHGLLVADGLAAVGVALRDLVVHLMRHLQ